MYKIHINLTIDRQQMAIPTGQFVTSFHLSCTISRLAACPQCGEIDFNLSCPKDCHTPVNSMRIIECHRRKNYP